MSCENGKPSEFDLVFFVYLRHSSSSLAADPIPVQSFSQKAEGVPFKMQPGTLLKQIPP
jgi:hypothetical protein